MLKLENGSYTLLENSDNILLENDVISLNESTQYIHYINSARGNQEGNIIARAYVNGEYLSITVDSNIFATANSGVNNRFKEVRYYW